MDYPVQYIREISKRLKELHLKYKRDNVELIVIHWNIVIEIVHGLDIRIVDMGFIPVWMDGGNFHCQKVLL